MTSIETLPPAGSPAYQALITRRAVPEEVRARTQVLLADVQLRGDRAVLDLTERFDGVRLTRTRVPIEEVHAALHRLDSGLRRSLQLAATHIEAVHAGQRTQEEPVDVVRSVRVWREWRPLARVGLYVPGGRTVYPSSVLMLAIPARLAGCAEIVLCSPPQPDGRVAPTVLAAAALAGVTEVHAVGGAQAIAAMAYGTASLRRVDKIFGPGNAYVTAAKLLVFGEVAIDMPAGPSEIVVIADGSVPAQWVAADLRAQTEHAPDARAVLVTTDPSFGQRVRTLLGNQPPDQIQILTSAHLDQALAFANDFAPEHLTLACGEPEVQLASISTAGSVFMGPYAAAAAGDYATGANHVLPTGGSSRSFSALGTEAFGRRMQVQVLDRDGLRRLEPIVDALAAAEALGAHRESVTIRRSGSAANPDLRWPRPRQAITSMQPYEWEPPSARIARDAGVPDANVIRFDTNTVPWPGAAVAELPALALNEYPDTSYAALTDALHRYTAVPAEGITVGAGADEILDLLAKAFIGPGDPVVLSRPTYAMFRIVSEVAGGRVSAVPTADLRLDLEPFLDGARHARLTWLCNPNNPTGEVQPVSVVAQLLDAAPGIVAVDEAYFEFSGITAAERIAQCPNLVIIRTMSKAFGLAGVRVGYALAGPAISGALRRVRPPGSLSVVSEALAVSALGDQEGMRRRVIQIIEARETLRAALSELGLDVLPSAGNFLLVQTGDGAAAALLRQGLVVRTFPTGSPLAGFIRITVRTKEANARLIRALSGWKANGR
jgi:histidinol dehydrogenase